LDLFPADKLNTQVSTIKPKKVCRRHPWVTASRLIDVTIKKTGKIVKRCLHCEQEKLEIKKEKLQLWKNEKENITDYYLRRTMRISSKLEMHEIPSELIEVKRAVIQLNRIKDELEKPLKICSFHGDLFRDGVIKNRTDRLGNAIWRCKKCLQIAHQKHYANNKKKVLEKTAEYREKNPEKTKQIRNISAKKHRNKYRERENHRKKLIERKYAIELSDRYVKKIIVKRTNLSTKDIPPTLIEIQRVITMLKRNIKKDKMSTKLIDSTIGESDNE
jgi:Zn-finger protein